MILNDRKHILCRKIGTTKQAYRHPSVANNAALMRQQGWEIVQEPQAPPVKEAEINPSFEAKIREGEQKELAEITIEQPEKKKPGRNRKETVPSN